MTQNTITTTVTFEDLIAQYDDELADLRDAYEDSIDLIKDRFGEDALDRPLPQDAEDDDRQELAELRVAATAYEESGKSIQRRKNALKRLRDAFDDGAFEVKMLTGEELLDVENELKMLAKHSELDDKEHYRKQLVVDTGVVDAPESVPREDGSPKPSRCGSPLTLALYQIVEDLNQAGALDFRAPGFGDSERDLSLAPAQSENPTSSGRSSSQSAPSAENTRDSGDSS